MHIISNGMVYKATRITGPTHHFLGVELSDEAATIAIRYANSEKEMVSSKFLDVIEPIIRDHDHVFPIDGRYYLKSVLVDEKDQPSSESYTKLFSAIVEKCIANTRQSI